MMGALDKRESRDTDRQENTGWEWRQRPESSATNRDANDSWQPLEAGRGKTGFLPSAFGGSMVLFTPRLQISGFLNHERKIPVAKVTQFAVMYYDCSKEQIH